VRRRLTGCCERREMRYVPESLVGLHQSRADEFPCARLPTGKTRQPGCVEMDLVAQCWDVNRGIYINSLVLTDVASGWTEAAPIIVREGNLVVEMLDRVRLGLPLRALDVDNVLRTKSTPFTRNRVSVCP
jgi:hypothetical protein